MFGLILTPFLWVWWTTSEALHHALSPRYRFGIYDAEIERHARYRARAAQVCFVVTYLVWHPAGLVETDLIGQAFEALVVMAFCVVPACLGIVALAPAGHRRRAARHVSLPVGVLAGAAAALVALTMAATRLPTIEPAGREPDGTDLIRMLAAVVLGLLIITAIVASLWVGVRLLSGNVFRAVDGHPTLRSLILLAFGAWGMTQRAIMLVDSGWPTEFPIPVALGLAFVSPILIAGLAVWELLRLRAVGITPRTACFC